MGMYVANRLREETKRSIEEVNALLPKSEYEETFDINSPALSVPKSMKEALLSLLKENPPKDDIDLFASVYRSMAMGYAKAVDELERITGETYAHTRVLVLQEELKTLPWGEVWDEYLRRQGMVSDAIMFEEVREYERQTLSKR